MALVGLSERELLLLTNYEYFNCSTYEGTIGDNINNLKNDDGSFNMEKVIAQGATGDIITEEAAVDILSRLDSDEKLRNLYASRNINEGGIRGTLYTSDEGSDAVVVFRGTGGTYKAWEDNVLGEYQTDTKLQKLAADFVKYECSEYKHITATGHSKGANLAQYVTVVCADQIDRCVAYDGQGMGDNARKAHKEEIKIASEKITAINGYNDFVNILLTPIAGTVLYVKNQEGLSVAMHSSYTLLSNGSFDDDGNFKRDYGVVPQLPAMTMAKWASSGIISMMSALPKDGEEKAANILAAYTASIFSNDKGEEYEKGKIDSALKNFRRYVEELLSIEDQSGYQVNCLCTSLFVDLGGLKRVKSELDMLVYELRKYPETVEDVLVRIDYSILGRYYTENALKRIIDKMDRMLDMLTDYSSKLERIILIYEEADKL